MRRFWSFYQNESYQVGCSGRTVESCSLLLQTSFHFTTDIFLPFVEYRSKNFLKFFLHRCFEVKCSSDANAFPPGKLSNTGKENSG